MIPDSGIEDGWKLDIHRKYQIATYIRALWSFDFMAFVFEQNLCYGPQPVDLFSSFMVPSI